METTVPASVLRIDSILERAIPPDTSGNFTEKVPPNPQHSSAASISRSVRPCTFESNGKTYRKLCPEYNTNKDLIHPNSPEARTRMGKGFILLLAKMFWADKLPPMDAPKPEILK